MSWIAISTVIISAVELALHAAEVGKQKAPNPSGTLADKTRWLQCIIKNETQFTIILQNTHFDSGRYWDGPGGMSPFDQMTFSACNGDNSIFTGVSGGTSFQIIIDKDHSYDFAIGWTNPYLGAIKAGVIQSDSAESGYDNATGTGNSIKSPQYQGKDKHGKLVNIYFHISAAPGQNALYTIREIRIEH